ncbi:MAG: hypothetical protein ABL925_04575 [Methylococcales bacterium]
MSLHITAMIPDRSFEDSALMNAITKVAIDLAILPDQRIQHRAPALDIVFLLSSRQETPGFVGLRLHSYDQIAQTLRIESAVPEKMVTSSHAEQFVIAIMQDAIDAAGEFFNEQRILFDVAGHFALLELVSPKQKYAVN